MEVKGRQYEWYENKENKKREEEIRGKGEREWAMYIYVRKREEGIGSLFRLKHGCIDDVSAMSM